MTEKNKLALSGAEGIVPQLRFPEFKQDGDWQETTLDDVADYENGKAHEQEISDTGKYKVVNSKFISTDGEVVKFTNSANLMANTGDILMVLSDIPNGRAIAKCFYVDEDDTYTVNQRICKITPTDIDNRFLFYIQNRNKYFLAFDDGVKQTNLRKDTVLSFPFLKPKASKEQQKIAACLSSLDEVITAETEKLDLLQDHKKGVLQQLFPAEGEAQPKFRFPEFLEDGDWEETTLDEIFNIYAGGDKPSNVSNIKTKEFYIPILSNGINDKALYGWTDKPKVKIPSLTISARGTIGWTSIQDNPFYPIVRLIVLSPRTDINLKYAYYFMKTIENNYKTPPAGIPQLTKPMIKDVKILIPVSLKEQQKIAACLSVADDLIEAQAQKVEVLQEHKKGLLQQLFPNLNELAV